MSAVAPASVGRAPQPADATGVLYERHSQRIFGYCLSLLGSREDAEDAVQTTFVNAQRGLGRGVVPQFELAWLFRIARNVCYNAHAASSRRGRHEGTVDLDALQDVLPAPERGTGPSIEELTRALADIPERQRRALLLREVRGLSYEEIAAELGVSVPAVETLIFRARRAVAEQFAQPGKRRRHGLLAPVSTALRWLLQGGAAPVKVAVATATLASTAALVAVVPGTQHPVQGPTPAPQKVAKTSVRVVPPAAQAKHGIARAHPRQVSLRGPVGTHTAAVPPPREAAARESQHTVSPPQQTAPAPAAAPPVSVGVPPVSTPTATVPVVTVPPVSLPPVGLPQVELPQVELPQVELPLETPSVPALPKLP